MLPFVTAYRMFHDELLGESVRQEMQRQLSKSTGSEGQHRG